MRESFRPFAPVVLREHVVEWFDVAPSLADSPFMLRVMRFRPERASRVPAVVHVDGTGRVQTVTPTLNPLLYRLIHEYWRRTGVPLLLNTSFNVAGEPIVETPDDALKCLIGTDLDICALGDWFVEKTAGRHALLECKVNVAITVAKVRRPLYTPPESDNGLAIRAFSAAADSPMLEYEIRNRFTGPVTEANIATRWGTVTHAIAGDWGDALTLLAAGHTGNDILNRIGRGDRGPSKEDLLALLQILLRLDLISFVTADKTINTSASVFPEDSLLDIYDKARGHEHPSPVTVLKDYVALLRKMGRENEADEIEASRGAI